MASEHPHFSLDDIARSLAATVGKVITPLVPAIVAAGLLMGITEGLDATMGGTLATNPWWILMHTFANASFIFLQILIGYSAARVFGGNEFLGAVIGMIANHTALMNAWDIPLALQAYGPSAYKVVGSTAAAQWLSSMSGDALVAADATSSAIMGAGGIPQVALIPGVYNVTLQGYQGHVLAIILAVFIMCKLEAWLHAHVPDMFDLFVTPLLTVLGTGLVTTVVIGPLFTALEELMLTFFQFLLSIPIGIGGALAGSLYPFTVVFGVHHLFSGFEASMCALTPPTNTFNPIVSASHVATAAASLAVFAKTNSSRTRYIAFQSGIAALLGVTDPALFAVNLPALRPFAGAVMGSAVGGALASALGVYATSTGATGVLGYLIASDITLYSLVIGAAFVVSFAATLILYPEELSAEEAIATTSEHSDVVEEAPAEATHEEKLPAKKKRADAEETDQAPVENATATVDEDQKPEEPTEPEQSESEPAESEGEPEVSAEGSEKPSQREKAKRSRRTGRSQRGSRQSAGRSGRTNRRSNQRGTTRRGETRQGRARTRNNRRSRSDR